MFRATKNTKTHELLRSFSKLIKFNPSNYYKILNIEEGYTVDDSELSEKFKSLQKIYHPDKLLNYEKDHRLIAEQNSSLINNAYQVLKDPYQRGIHLLNLNNYTIEEDEQSDNLSNNFLDEIIELNEKIIEISDSKNELNKMLNELNDEKTKIVKLIEKNFLEKNYLEAKKQLIKLKFYNNITNKVLEFL